MSVYGTGFHKLTLDTFPGSVNHHTSYTSQCIASSKLINANYRIYLIILTRSLNTDNQRRAVILFLRHTIVFTKGVRIFTHLPSTTASRPRLRSRLTLSRLALPRKPWVFGVKVFHFNYRYSSQHSHFKFLQYSSRIYLLRIIERSPTNL